MRFVFIKWGIFFLLAGVAIPLFALDPSILNPGAFAEFSKKHIAELPHLDFPHNEGEAVAKFMKEFRALVESKQYDVEIEAFVRHLRVAPRLERGLAEIFAEQMESRQNDPKIQRLLKQLFIIQVVYYQDVGSGVPVPVDYAQLQKVFEMITASEAHLETLEGPKPSAWKYTFKSSKRALQTFCNLTLKNIAEHE